MLPTRRGTGFPGVTVGDGSHDSDGSTTGQCNWEGRWLLSVKSVLRWLKQQICRESGRQRESYGSIDLDRDWILVIEFSNENLCSPCKSPDAVKFYLRTSTRGDTSDSLKRELPWRASCRPRHKRNRVLREMTPDLTFRKTDNAQCMLLEHLPHNTAGSWCWIPSLHFLPSLLWTNFPGLILTACVCATSAFSSVSNDDGREI